MPITQKHTLDLIDIGVNLLEDGNRVRSSLSSAVFSSGEYISTSHGNWYAGFLNGRGLLPTFFENPHQQLPFEAELFEFVPFRVCNILKNTTTKYTYMIQI